MPNGNLRRIASALINDESASSIVDELLAELDLELYVRSCDHCRDLCAPDDMHTVDDDSTWCQDCCEDHAHFWGSDDSYHTEEEPEPEPDEYGIPDYHDTAITIPEDVLRRSDVLGIELETYQSSISVAADAFSSLREDWNDEFKYERDGSLDDKYGVEIAARPFTLAEVRSESGSPWFKLLEWSRANGGKAWDAGKGYGMHVSLNAAAMSGCHRARIVRFVNDNADLCTQIAGRAPNDWAKFRKCGKLSEEAKESPTKYQAATNRGTRIEVRIFRASLNWTRFVRNCEFVDAIRVYTLTCGITDRALSATAFLGWLSTRSNGNRKSYPLLYDFFFPRAALTAQELALAD